jgi:hypothetical protein
VKLLVDHNLSPAIARSAVAIDNVKRNIWGGLRERLDRALIRWR